MAGQGLFEFGAGAVDDPVAAAGWGLDPGTGQPQFEHRKPGSAGGAVVEVPFNLAAGGVPGLDDAGAGSLPVRPRWRTSASSRAFSKASAAPRLTSIFSGSSSRAPSWMISATLLPSHRDLARRPVRIRIRLGDRQATAST